jgi:hypothetical protein
LESGTENDTCLSLRGKGAGPNRKNKKGRREQMDDMGLILFIAAFLGLIPAAIAHSKGRNAVAWWFFGWMLFVVALPCALFVSNISGKKCKECAEYIPEEARRCKHCGAAV